MKTIVIDARSRGSTGRYANKLLDHLQAIDKTNRYFVLVKSEQAWQPKNPSFQSVITDVEDYTFAEQFKLWWIIRKLKPDLVHFTMPQQPLLPIGTARVTTFHDLTMLRFHNINGNSVIYWFKLFVFRGLAFWVTHFSKAVITPTRWVKTDAVKTFHADPKRFFVTYEAVEPINDKAEPMDDLINEEFILFNGNVFPHKNVERLIMAYKSIKKQHPKLKLVIAGKLNDEGQKLRDATEAIGVEGVIWTGYVSDAHLKWLQSNAKVYVYPSLSEGFGLPPLESMLAGVPVAVSNATCLPEVCGDAASYFDPYDPDDMTKVVGELLDNKKLRSQRITDGKKHVEKFSWRRMARQTLDIYNSVLN